LEWVEKRENTHSTQSFYSSVDFVRDNPGELIPEDTFHHLLDFWSKMKITQTDSPTIWMDCYPIQTNWCPTSAIPTIFMQDALPYITLPIYPGLGQAPNMLACVPSGLVWVEKRELRGKSVSVPPGKWPLYYWYV